MSEHSWYSIKASANVADVFIYDTIGQTVTGDKIAGITSAAFARDLGAISAGTINVRINTPGGSIFEGLAIYNSLKSHPARVVVHVDGVAASIGSVIAMAADEIRMSKSSHLMIHNAFGKSEGEAVSMRSTANLLDRLSDTIANIYADRTGISVPEIKAMMDAETWMTADEAKAKRFCDVIVDAAAAVTNSFDLSRFTNVPTSLIASAELTDKEIPMEEIEMLKQQIAALQAEVDALKSGQSTPSAMAEEEKKDPAAEVVEGAPTETTAPVEQLVEVLTETVETIVEEAIGDTAPATANVLRKMFPDASDNGFIIDQLSNKASVAKAAFNYVAYSRQKLNAQAAKINELSNKVSVATGSQGAVGFVAPQNVAPVNTDDPKAVAAHEWDTLKPQGFTSKDRYVAIRSRELMGQFKSFGK